MNIIIPSAAAILAATLVVACSGCATSTTSNSTKIDLTQALKPDNRFTDPAMGMSVTLPTGWTIRDAARWGEGQRENTLQLQPARASSAIPSAYYTRYSADEAQAYATVGAEAVLREGALKKEAARRQQMPDYRNEPESFLFFMVNGRPTMAYLATFTSENQLMTEHFVRILGTQGYVMFFTKGKIADVKAILPELMQAVSTVQWP